MREPGVHAELQPRAARVRVPAHAPRTRPQSGRPSSKRTGWGARPYACTRSRPVDPDRRLLSDAARCNSAAGYRHARGSLLVRSRVFHTRPRVRFPPRARFLEGEVCEVQTPVPKTGWRASVRVRLLHLPPLEDDLAVARAPFATRMDPDGLRFDSAGFRASFSFRTLHRSGPTRPAGSTGTSFVRWPYPTGHRARRTRACTFRFRAPRRRSPTRKHLVRLQIGPPRGPNADGRHFPVKETSLRLRHSGARAFLACPAEQSPHATWIAHW